MSQDDAEAAAERILYIDTPGAAEFLEGLGQERLEALIEGFGMARHALWLEEQMADQINHRQHRFLVECSKTDLAVASLLNSKEDAEDFFEWLLWLIHQAEKLENIRQYQADRMLGVTSSGELIIHTKLVSQSWDMYPGNRRGQPPRASVVKSFLAPISDAGSKSYTVDGKSMRGYRITLEKLLHHVEQLPGCDVEEFEEAWQLICKG
jgi:hypothetical protein